MMKIYRSGKGPKFPNNGPEAWDKFFYEYGWNWKEFSAEWKEWNGGTGTYSEFEESQRKK